MRGKRFELKHGPLYQIRPVVQWTLGSVRYSRENKLTMVNMGKK